MIEYDETAIQTDYSKMTQQESVMHYLEQGYKLDRMSALNDLGVIELGARICELIQKGIPVQKRNKTVNTRYAGQTTVKEYYI